MGNEFTIKEYSPTDNQAALELEVIEDPAELISEEELQVYLLMES